MTTVADDVVRTMVVIIVEEEEAEAEAEAAQQQPAPGCRFALAGPSAPPTTHQAQPGLKRPTRRDTDPSPPQVAHMVASGVLG